MSASFEKPEPRKVTLRNGQGTITCNCCKQEFSLEHFTEVFGTFYPTYYKTCKSCCKKIKMDAKSRYNWERLLLLEREASNPLWHLYGVRI